MKSRRSSAELVEELAGAIVRERLELEQLDVATLSFARMGDVSAEVGRQVALDCRGIFPKRRPTPSS